MDFRLLSVAALLSACTTAGKVETFEDDGFEAKSKTAESSVGVNDKGQAILQTEKDAGVELQSQQMANYSLRERLGLEIQDMQRCHEELLNLKGGGAADAPPEIDIPEEAGPDDQVGMNASGELKVRRTELFTERLETERKRGKKLDQLLKQAKKLNDKCQGELRVAKAKKP